MRLLLICSLFFCLACQNNHKTSITELGWLVGGWQRQEGTKFYWEEWKKIDETHLQANGFVLKGADTVMQEQILLEQRNDGIFFIPVVKDQNEGKAVEFKLISAENRIFVFENKAHDFPQRIVYTNPHKDTLDAWIEGESNGKMRRIPFKMAKLL